MNKKSEKIFFKYIPQILEKSFLKNFSQSSQKDIINEDGLKEYFKELKNEELYRPLILVGSGTCGLGAGAQKVYNEIEKYVQEKSLAVDIKKVGCIGLCSQEPLIEILMPDKNPITFGKVSEKDVNKILNPFFGDGEIPKDKAVYQKKSFKKDSYPEIIDMMEHPFFEKQERIVLKNCGVIDPLIIEEYVARGGYQGLFKTLHSYSPEKVCDEVLKSGLRGRGGGGFPTGRKWQFALNATSPEKVVICNADEGDPGAFMDRAVIEGDPHRVLEGLIISAYAIRANLAYIYIRAEYPLAIENLEKAIKDAEKWGFIGDNILDSGFSIKVLIKKGAGAFVCGEETALIHSIEGKRGMPRPRPPFPAAKGLHSKPTIINNVETLANVSSIISNGADWFGSMGTDGSKGTKVFALSGKINRTGLIEVPMGISVHEVVYKIGGGIPKNKKFKAVQMGGPSGGCVPEQHLDIPIDYESIKTIGAMMGSGGMVVMDEDNCMVDVAKFFMDFIQRESCGKCIPCREGTKRMLNILESLTQGRKTEEGDDALYRFKGVMLLEELAETIQTTSLCGLGQSAPNPVVSTLRFFRHEYEEHIFSRKCPAKVCGELVSFEIDVEKCIGCTICAKKCPSDAIVSKVKAPHFIKGEECIKCGVCFDVCRFEAVVKA